MKAIAYDRFGGLDVLHEADLPKPKASRGEVVVQVNASSINVIDTRVRTGSMGILVNKKFPKIPGADLAGVVAEIGPGVSAFKVGDRVFGALDPFKGGAFAEFAAVPDAQLAAMPAQLSFEAAASAPVAGIAALIAIRDLAHVTAGSKVLIHGASGGVGLFAVQFAKASGAHVTAVAGAAGVAAAAAMGADVVIDYRKGDVGRASGLYDLIMNNSGQFPYAKAAGFLTARGVLVEPSPTIPVVIGSTIANLVRSKRHAILMAKITRPDLETLASGLAGGTLKTTIAKSYPLSEARAAFALQEKGGVVGKVIVTA